MPTPAERQALIFVAAVAALGAGVRGWRAIDHPAAAPAATAALADQLARVDSVIASGGHRRSRTGGCGRRGPGQRDSSAGPPAAPSPLPRTRPSPGPRPPRTASPEPSMEPIDVDLATVDELDRLPGIGPALAARIVEERARLGPFGSMDALDQVRGIGPALAERLRTHVTFSG